MQKMKVWCKGGSERNSIVRSLILHSKQNPISLHVPGHKNGELFQKSKYTLFRNFLKIDLTELSGLDDLHSPEDVIMKAEELLSQVYGVKQSFFLVNGSTVGNLAMIMAALKENDEVLVQRNCHKSILNGIQLARAQPIFLGPDYHEVWGITGGVSSEIVARAMDLYPHAKGLILTYPNYYGMVNELGKIIEMAHSRKIPVLVDEAHGAHFISGGEFPKSAVQLGADIVVQSAHKTLPAMTMGSYLHFNSSLLSADAVENYLHILQSSSPSYPIMASLDFARSYIGTYLAEDHDYLQGQLDHFKQNLMELRGVKVLTGSDSLKITLQTENEWNGFQMQQEFEKEGIFTELADPFNVLLVLPLLKKDMKYPFENIINGFNKVLKTVKKKQWGTHLHEYHPTISTLKVNREDSRHLSKVKVNLSQAIGEIAAERVIPYPPGIPILFPGEQITTSIVAQIQYLLEAGARFQGSKDIFEKQLSVYK